MTRSWLRWLLLGVALALAVAGQINFAKGEAYFADGAALYLLAGLAFWYLVRPPSAPTVAAEPRPARTWQEWLRLGLAGAGLALAVFVVVRLLGLPATNSDRRLAALWGVAMLLYLLAFAHLPRWTGGEWRAWARGHAAEWLIVVGLAALALGLRAWHVDTIPWTVGGDEGSEGIWGRYARDGVINRLFLVGAAPHTLHDGKIWQLGLPHANFWWQALWLVLAGDNVFGLRFSSVVFGTLSVVGTFLLVQRLFSRGLALLAAVLLVGAHFHLHYSRIGAINIGDTAFMTFALYFLVVGWQDNRRWAWALSGLVLGTWLYFYTGSRQGPIVMSAALGWAALTRRDFLRRHRTDLLVLLGAFLIAAGPIAVMFLQRPEEFNGRLPVVGVIQSGWLDREAAATGRSKLDIMLEQTRKALLVFVYTRDKADWYRPETPLLDFASSVFFVLGVAYALSRIRQWRFFVLLVWLFVVLFVGGALTINTPESQRLIGASVPAVSLVAVGLWQTVACAGRLLELTPRTRAGLVALAAVAIVVANVYFYFGPYQQLWTYGSFNGEVATRVGYYADALGPGWRLYFFGAPRMYVDYATIPFIAKSTPYYDVKEPLRAPPTFVDPGQDALFVFLPERLGELALVRELYPNGTLEEVRRVGKPDGPILFIAYRVPRESLADRPC